MKRPLGFLFIGILMVLASISSCQQRYRHVKKVHVREYKKDQGRRALPLESRKDSGLEISELPITIAIEKEERIETNTEHSVTAPKQNKKPENQVSHSAQNKKPYISDDQPKILKKEVKSIDNDFLKMLVIFFFLLLILSLIFLPFIGIAALLAATTTAATSSWVVLLIFSSIGLLTLYFIGDEKIRKKHLPEVKMWQTLLAYLTIILLCALIPILILFNPIIGLVYTILFLLGLTLAVLIV